MKKIVSLTLAAILVMSLAMSATATMPVTVLSDESEAGTGDSGGTTELTDPDDPDDGDGGGETGTKTPAVSTGKISGMAADLSKGIKTTDLGEIAPNSDHVEYITLYDTMFTWSDGFVGDAENPVKLTAAQIRNGKLDVRAKSSKAIKDVSINTREGRIEVEFVKEYVATKEFDFEVEIYLLIDNKRQSDYSVTLSGTLANPVEEVYAEEDKIDISGGEVIEAKEYNSKAELYLGNDVTLITKLFSGKKYYGIASRTPDRSDDTVLTKYKDIEEVFILKTVGLGSSSDIVRLGSAYRDHYIYDEDLNYLGRGKDDLPFASRYYAATKELVIEEESDGGGTAEELPPTDAENGDGQGAKEPEKNNNDNPNTGR